jgi:hypothetical protein
MKHPADSLLALHAGGDGAMLDRWRTRYHLRHCERCRRQVQAYADASAAVRGSTPELPGYIKWNDLAAEMTANIRVGIAAGECVGPIPQRVEQRLGWRAAAVMAGMTAVLTTALWLNPVPRRQHALTGPKVEIRTTSAGLEVNENGNTLTLVHRRGGLKPIIVSAPGSLRSRFIDAETGQVTIHNVYAE